MTRVEYGEGLRTLSEQSPMIDIEETYSGTCIFCDKQTHYRSRRATGMKHEVCKDCSSKTDDCADEKFAIRAEHYPVDGKGNSIPRRGKRVK